MARSMRSVFPAWRIALALVAFCCIAACVFGAGFTGAPHAAYAAEGEATLTLVLKHEENGAVRSIPGAEFTVYQVARIGSDNAYEPIAPYDSASVDFNATLTASEMQKAAESMAKLARGQGAGAKKTVSGDDGLAAFGALQMGVYLVIQTGATGEAEKYYEIAPFLVNVPQMEGGDVAYDVVATPKPELKPVDKSDAAKPKPSSSTPRTGDLLSWGFAAVAVGLLAMSLALLAARRRRG